MAISDSLALSSPYGKPPTSKHEEWRARVLERGSTLAPCPECGTEAERETPCYTFRPGLRWVVTVYRCPICGVVKQTEAAPEEPEVREEPVPMSEPVQMSTEELLALPLTCECGCGLVPREGRRFASRACVGRGTVAKMRATKAASKEARTDWWAGLPDEERRRYEELWGYLTEEQKAARRAEPPPAPPLPVVPETPHAPASLLGVVKTYLRKLTPDGRAALLELVDAEDYAARVAQRAAELGVA